MNGCFSNFGRVDDVTRAMSKGGGACGYLCKIPGKSTPLPPPLSKAFPYAYGQHFKVLSSVIGRLEA